MTDPQPAALPLLHIDVASHTVWVGDRDLRMTLLAWRLLLVLARHAGRVLSYDELIDQVWEPGQGSDGHLKRLICDLRTAIGDDARHPRYLVTVRDVGYRLELDTLDPASVLEGGVRPGLAEQVRLLEERLARVEGALAGGRRG